MKHKKSLGFNALYENSIDAVSDRDYIVETLNNINLTMIHLSRFAEEIIFWSSEEAKFITLSDGFSTGSSIMPQKKTLIWLNLSAVKWAVRLDIS